MYALKHVETMAKYLRLYPYTEAVVRFSNFFDVPLQYSLKVRAAVEQAAFVETEKEKHINQGENHD